MKTTVLSILFFSLLFFFTNNSTRAQENIATGKKIAASGITKSRRTPYLTDGNLNTMCYPASSNGTVGFYFDIDLDKEYNLDKIILFNNPTSKPERLSNYTVEVFSNHFGTMGEMVWKASIRADNSNSGIGGKDTIHAGLDSNGIFNGRFIRITNYSTAPQAPTIAEIEIYEAPLPVIHFFETNTGNITQQSNTSLLDSAKLSWSATAYDTLIINPEIGSITTDTGFVKVSPKTRTTYTLRATNNFGTVSESITIGVDEAYNDPSITEFLTSNAATFEDEDMDKPDWIELYNPNDYSLNIGGFFLTDDFNVRNKWKIPSCNIAPNSYLVIFASGKDRRSQNAPLHTNFKLNSDGEFLALVAKDSATILQQFPTDFPLTPTFPEQETDVSYGLDVNGEVGFFSTPTPNKPNTIRTVGFADDVKFTPNRGIYNFPVSLALTCATPDVIIRYTSDGSEPTETNGKTYSEPINISTTTVVIARAFKQGLVPTIAETHSYILVNDVIESKVMDKTITGNAAYKTRIESGLKELPSISIVTTGNINETREVKTSVEWIGLTQNDDLHVNAGIQYFGGSYTRFDKRNFRLYFRGIYGETKFKHPVFEGFDHSIPAVDAFDQLELRAGGHDMAQRGFYMSNRLTDDLMLESGHLNPHGRFVNLYMNGIYWGQYHLRERWNASTFAQYFKGSKDNFDAINGNFNAGGWSMLDTPYDGDGLTWEYVKSQNNNYKTIKNYLDVPQYINFMLMYMYGNCESEYRSVGAKADYLGNGFKFYFNDADGFTRDTGNRTNMGQPGRLHADGPGSIFSMLLKEAHPDYISLLADQIYELFFNNGVMTPDRITSILNKRCEEVENSIVAECARWGYRTPTNWEEAKNKYINTVLNNRTETVIEQFKAAGFYPSLDAPEFSRNGGIVEPGFPLTLSSNVSGIYYTSDGSDPRSPGGQVSENASVYSSVSREMVSLIESDTDVSAWIPTNNNLDTSWTTSDFNVPANWLRNTKGAGVGYDKNATYESYIDLSVKDEMLNKNASAYVRYLFDVNEPSDINLLELNMRCDDGFVAYLNGEVIASLNAPGNLTWNSAATTNKSDAQAVLFTKANFTHQSVLSLLRKGENVLAIHGLNHTVGSSDFLIEAELNARVVVNPTEIDFIPINEPVTINARSYDGREWSALSKAVFDTLSTDVAVGVMSVSELSFLSQNFPNPFNDHTTISFAVNDGLSSSLEIFNTYGQSMWRKDYSNEEFRYMQRINTSDWAEGVYIYRLKTSSGILKTGKMIRVK